MYLTYHNGVGVNLVKVDGRKIRVLDLGSISPFRQKKLKVSSEQIVKHILVNEPDLFSNPEEIISVLIELEKSVINLDIFDPTAENNNHKSQIIWHLCRNIEILMMCFNEVEI